MYITPNAQARCLKIARLRDITYSQLSLLDRRFNFGLWLGYGLCDLLLYKIICTKLTVDGLTWGAWDPLVTVELAWVTMTFWGDASLLLCCCRLEPVQIIITILLVFASHARIIDLKES